jgi:hypothetical protein
MERSSFVQRGRYICCDDLCFFDSVSTFASADTAAFIRCVLVWKHRQFIGQEWNIVPVYNFMLPWYQNYAKILWTWFT